MATIKLKDYLLSLSSKGSSANNDKITILDSADGNKIKSILKSDLVDLTYIVEELRDDFLDTLGDNVISSSAQVNADTITNFDTNVKAKINSDGVLSGSSQVTLGGFDTDNLSEGSSNLYYTNVRVKTKLNAESVISSSAQIDGEFLNTTGDDVVSSSIQITITDTTGFTTLSSSLQSTDNAIAARVTAVESFSSSLDSTYASDSELTAVSSSLSSTIDSLTTADVTEDSSNKYYTDVRVKSKLNTETVVSSSAQVNFGDVSGDTDGVDEGSNNLYYTDVRVKTKLTAEDVVSGSNSNVKTFLAISASDISDVEAFSQSGTYSGLRAQSTTAGDVDLGNVTNESKATMFTSPAFTTNPTAPTQTGTDDSTKLATTEFVQARITDIIGNAGSTLDTLGELSASLAEDSGSLSTLTTTVGTKLAKASNLSDLQDAATARTNLGVDAAGTVNYVLPTDLAGDDIDIDTTPLTGATVISDLDINITTNTSGLVTDANGTVATRTLTATDLSLGSSDDVTFNKITGSGIEITGHLDVDGNINGNSLAIGTGSADYIIHAKGTGLTNRIRLEEDTTQNQLTLIDVKGVDDELAVFGFGGSTYVHDLYKSRAVVSANSNLDGVSIVSSNNNGSIIFGVGTSPSISNTERARVSAEGIHITGSLNVKGEQIISSSQAEFATTIRNVHDSSEGLLVQSTDNDTGLHLLKLQSSNGTLLEADTDWVDRFNVTKAGAVGINTATPQKPLHIEGTGAASEMQILASSASDTVGHTAGIGLRAEGGESDGPLRIKGGIFFEREAGDYGVGKMHFANNGAQSNASVTVADKVLTISGSGHVGIGTALPANGKLEVQQSATDAALWVQTGGTTDAYTIADFRTGTNLSALAIKGNGGVVFGGNTVTGNKTSVSLNYYEEGTWTPTITNANGTLVVAGYDGTGSPAGQYTRVGRMVTLFLQFEITDLDGASSGALVITGMPFNCTLAGGVGGQGVIPTTGKTLNIARYSDTTLNSYQADGSFAGTGTHPTSFVIHYNV